MLGQDGRVRIGEVRRGWSEVPREPVKIAAHPTRADEEAS
jgi:hypothetical protein